MGSASMATLRGLRADVRSSGGLTTTDGTSTGTEEERWRALLPAPSDGTTEDRASRPTGAPRDVDRRDAAGAPHARRVHLLLHRRERSAGCRARTRPRRPR